jgi:lipoprotein-releasing system ATP-binding protein
MEIPYRALRFANQPVQSWGFNFHRRLELLNEQHTWNHIDNTVGRWTQYDGLITDLREIKPTTRLNLYPYQSSITRTFQGKTDFDWAVGMDIKYGLTENFTLDATLIPELVKFLVPFLVFSSLRFSKMITGKNLHKSFGDIEVLKGVNIDVKKGEIVAIVGPSGAGKTTLLQILGTLDKPDSSSTYGLNINNIEIKNLSDSQISKFRNEQVGFIFQFHQLLPEFTALENVCIPAFIGKKSKKEAETKAKEILDYLGLSDRYHHKPNELSGGEQQRVAVARALINNPAVILADEPSGNLDSQSAENLHDLFFKLRDEFNQTFVIVTHNETLADMADRKLVMKDGVIL